MSTIGKIHEYFDENLDFSLFVDQREKKKKKKRGLDSDYGLSRRLIALV